MFSRFHRPTPLFLLFSVGGVIVLLGLGTWQLQRLAWKEELIAKVEHAARDAPLQKLPYDHEEMQAKQFYTVELTGIYLPHEFHLAARYHEGKLGYAILTPFRLEDGRTVLVNRGWVPTALKEESARPEDTTGIRTIKAQIRTSNERNFVTPVNQPEKNLWFGRDVVEMAKYSQIALEPLTLDLIGPQDLNKLPVPSDGHIAFRNDHLGYAITWFALAIGLAVIALLYNRKKPEEA